jgi:NNP family nitrate/nitrite transporter-like MFS transporter
MAPSVMIVLSCFVQTSEGSIFSIVPYVNPAITGSIAGIVGAGGNVGGVAFATIFRSHNYYVAFSAMGWISMISAFLTLFLFIRGHAGLCCASDTPEIQDR